MQVTREVAVVGLLDNHLNVSNFLGLSFRDFLIFFAEVRAIVNVFPIYVKIVIFLLVRFRRRQ